MSTVPPTAASNGDTQIEPASLTKMMTAYLAFNALENGATAELAPTDPAAVIDAGFATAFADAAD